MMKHILNALVCRRQWSTSIARKRWNFISRLWIGNEQRRRAKFAGLKEIIMSLSGWDWSYLREDDFHHPRLFERAEHTAVNSESKNSTFFHFPVFKSSKMKFITAISVLLHGSLIAASPLLQARDDRGSYTVSGLGARKQAVTSAGGTTLDLAIAMLETFVPPLVSNNLE